MALRLDQELVRRGLSPDIARAVAEIRSGNVLVDEVGVDKPGAPVKERSRLRFRELPSPFVSRGGLKLQAGLEAFQVEVQGLVCVDLGASTGGFTDCLLQRGASRVYAVDVAYGVLAWSLRSDPRVVVLDRTNARTLEALPEAVSLLVGDLSFISLTSVLPTIRRLVPRGGHALVLVKPQFEVGRRSIGAGGRVVDEAAVKAALENVAEAAAEVGFAVLGRAECPVPGARAHNREWLFYLG